MIKFVYERNEDNKEFDTANVTIEIPDSGLELDILNEHYISFLNAVGYTVHVPCDVVFTKHSDVILSKVEYETLMTKVEAIDSNI